MKKAESKLWSKIKIRYSDTVHFARVENWAVPGTPDLNCCVEGLEFWLELKVLGPKASLLKNLRPHQISWQCTRRSHKGLVLNLVSRPSSSVFQLYPGISESVLRDPKSLEPISTSNELWTVDNLRRSVEFLRDWTWPPDNNSL